MMELTTLANKIFTLNNNNIRFIGLINRDGILLHWWEKNGNYDERLHKNLFMQIAIEAEMHKVLNNEYGHAQFIYIERAKAKQFIIFGKKNMLLVSLEPSINTSKALGIIDEVIRMIKQ